MSTMRIAVSFIVLLLALAGGFDSARPSVGRAAAPGAIRGRVEVRRIPASVERRTPGADFALNEPRPSPDRSRAVVYLESAPRGAFEATERGRAVMDQRNETFLPHVVAITTGTRVDFPNSDPFYHNVFSLSKAARFDLGRYAAGRSQSVRFDQPGIVRVFCDIHSHMSAFILVFSHPFYAVTDADGRYRIPNVPPGTYHLVAWHEGVSSNPTAAVVPDGSTTEVDFTLR
jgi:plastocyanin